MREQLALKAKKYQSEQFQHLRSIIYAEGDIGADVTHKIKAGWTKWRNVYGVLCDRRIPVRLKGKFYKTAI